MIADVREPELDDIARLIGLAIKESVDASEQEKVHFIERCQQNLRAWKEGARGGVHAKYVVDGRIVGVVMVRDFWNLCHLFVTPDMQHRGIGTALLLHALAQCDDASPRSHVQLNSTRNAKRFYLHNGFAPVEDSPAVYQGMQLRRPCKL